MLFSNQKKDLDRQSLHPQTIVSNTSTPTIKDHQFCSILLMKKGVICIALMIMTLCMVDDAVGQARYLMRLKLDHVSAEDSVACYHLQIQNSSDSLWRLGSGNIAIFYDYSVACIDEDTSEVLLDKLDYDRSLLSNKIQPIAMPLVPYHESLGFIRVNFNAKRNGKDLEQGVWYDIYRLCFDLTIGDIHSPSTCMQVNFQDSMLLTLTNGIGDVIQTYDEDPERYQDAIRDEAINIVPDATYNSCFVIEENSVELCSDGIDNDEDGLTDCDDPSGCGVESPAFQVNGVGGCDDRESLIRVINAGDGAEFSIDGGDTWQKENEFVGLPVGQYTVSVRRFGLSDCAGDFPVEVREEECTERTDQQCSDGIDNDEDGLIDCDDPDCHSIPDITVSDSTDCPLLEDGSITLSTMGASYEVSIDSGQTYMTLTDDQITDLDTGSYYLFYKNTATQCITPHDGNPVIIEPGRVCPGEQGRCADGDDNDADGLIDCLDPDCATDVNCLDLAAYYVPNAINPRSAINNSFGLYTESGKAILIKEINIYDRWGNIVHHRENVSSQDASHQWRGIHNGTEVSPGVYTYTLSIEQLGVSDEIVGTVSVVY